MQSNNRKFMTEEKQQQKKKDSELSSVNLYSRDFIFVGISFCPKQKGKLNLTRTLFRCYLNYLF